MIEPVSARASGPMLVPKPHVANEKCRENSLWLGEGQDADERFEQAERKKLEPGGAERGLECPFSRRNLDVLGDRIALISAQIQAATYQLLVMIREFDEREGWFSGTGGAEFRSCAHWLNWRTGLDLGAAREKVRVARALVELPLISEAMRRGEISYSKVRALTRVATADNEGDLLEFARAGTASHVEKLVRAWRRVDRFEELELEEKRRGSRELQIYTDEDGMVVMKARLEPEAGAAVLKAIETAEQTLFDRGRVDDAEDEVPACQRRADAIGLVAECALAQGLGASPRADRLQVVIHVDQPVLEDPDLQGVSMLDEGQNVSAETSRRLACDCSTVVMKHDLEGRTLDVGRKTRVVSTALRRALTHRDGSCQFPGCASKYCEAHHIQHWAEGGETNLENLVLLCRRHHRALHEEGYHLERSSDGVSAARKWRFFRPDGSEMVPAPPQPEVGEYQPEVPKWLMSAADGGVVNGKSLRGADINGSGTGDGNVDGLDAGGPDADGAQFDRLGFVEVEELARITSMTGLPSWDGGSWDLEESVRVMRAIGREVSVTN